MHGKVRQCKARLRERGISWMLNMAETWNCRQRKSFRSWVVCCAVACCCVVCLYGIHRCAVHLVSSDDDTGIHLCSIFTLFSPVLSFGVCVCVCIPMLNARLHRDLSFRSLSCARFSYVFLRTFSTFSVYMNVVRTFNWQQPSPANVSAKQPRERGVSAK